MLKSLLFAFPDASWRDACCVASNYASRLTNIKNKTPGEIAGRFFFGSGLCSCEGQLLWQSLPRF
jgi:hypothetical protein